MEELDRETFLAALNRVLDRLEQAADQLSSLDAAMGDGDMGVTVTLGCRAIRAALPGLRSQDLGTVVARSAMAFNSTAPSTLGALFAIGGMRAGKEARDAEAVNLSLLARMVRAAETGIMEKGKAQRGDKTLLDALGPAADALENAASQGDSLEAGVGAATAAAREGVERTVQLAARSGRGSWISERTVGHPDPGATAILVIWEAFDEILRDMAKSR